MDRLTPESFQQKRQELISVLDDIRELTIDGNFPIVSQVQESISRIRDWRSEILLVGGWESGTSTLFNVICGGREISPLGYGIRTQACKISAQSIPRDQNERVDLRWKSDDELMQVMVDIIRDNLVNDEEGLFLFSKKDDMGNDVLPSLSDATIRSLAKKAIHAEWERYYRDPVRYDFNGSGRLDQLHFSTLILKYYGTAELEALRDKTSVDIEEHEPFIVFPCDWAIQWSTYRENVDWSIKEVAFVFLRDVLFHIHSTNFEHLGCVITECPKPLLGSQNATVAWDAMVRADAIICLLNGNVTVSGDAFYVLSQIRRAQQEHKVVLAINARSEKKNIVDYIRPVDFAMIKPHGITLDDSCGIAILNARLAYLASKTVDDEKEWKREVRRTLVCYLGLDLTDDTQLLTEEALILDRDKLYELSGVGELLSNVCERILSRRMEAVLEKGVMDARRELDIIRGYVLAAERDPEMDYTPFEKSLRSNQGTDACLKKSSQSFHDSILRIGERIVLFQNGLKPYLEKKDETE